MSYVRWGKDSTVYAYAHVDGGWTTHVGLTTYNDPTLEAFRKRLVGLREAGEKVPDHVFEEIDAQMADPDPNSDKYG